MADFTPAERTELLHLIATRFATQQIENLLYRLGLEEYEIKLSQAANAETVATDLVKYLEGEAKTIIIDNKSARGIVFLLRGLLEETGGNETEADFLRGLLVKLSSPNTDTARPLTDLPTPSSDKYLDDLAQQNARRILGVLALVALVAWVIVFGAIYWLGSPDLAGDFVNFLTVPLALIGVIIFAVRGHDLYQDLVQWERKRLETKPIQPHLSPPQNQREVERKFLHYRKTYKDERIVNDPDLIVDVEGTGEIYPEYLYQSADEDNMTQDEREMARAVRDKHFTRETKPYEDVIDAVQTICRPIALLGEPGGGKTTAIRKLELHLIAEAEKNAKKPIPIFVPLGDWLEAKQSLTGFISEKMGELGSYQEALMTQRRAIFLLDGLNEIPTDQRPTKLPHVKRLLERVKGHIAVVSCRELDYPALDLKLDKLTITLFDPIRIREVARRFLKERGDLFFWKLVGDEGKRLYDDFGKEVVPQFRKQKFENWESVFWREPTLPATISWGYGSGQ